MFNKNHVCEYMIIHVGYKTNGTVLYVTNDYQDAMRKFGEYEMENKKVIELRQVTQTTLAEHHPKETNES